MVSLTGPWSEADLTAFLQREAIPIRLGCRRPDGSPWMLSLWYRYEDGRFECATSADADVVRYLAADDAVSFEVSTNDPPYRGVRGHGTATVTPDEEKATLRALVDRYLGDRDHPLARRLLSPERSEVTIAVDPERLHTWDYSDRM